MPLPGVLQRAGEMAAAGRRLFEIIDAKPAVAEPRAPAAPAVASAEPADLSIRNLRFRYAADLPWVLDGLSLDVPAGERLAVVGPTGAGKSSLVNLLLRFWDYEGGSITVGGADLRRLRTDDARALFSVVPQSPYLFHASLRQNLLIAGGGGASEAELWSALETAQLAGLVAALPEGLDTVVGEHGAEMSAGQVQRIAVARALLKEAAVYLLDEATEGLDEQTADLLLAAVERRLAGRTLVIISHRARDLRMADRVCELKPAR